ncbi:putative pyridoxal reductase [Phaeomoniella chlamydospora]|uniref:Putative pyridoxal reductase n=1 Tax=Phaeomoniella chlamydospora TaxID=158046 RepID=A0A0G2GY40_PHACM|nr:putative pyridoxal reductase [Phaeomoniella chlamydospora]
MAAIDVSKLGPSSYGMMRLTWNPTPPTQEQAFETLNAAIKNGYRLWNGGEIYGTPERNSLHLLREYFTKYPENASKVTINIKGGCKKGDLMPDGSRANVRRSVEDSLAALGGTHKIDIFECARVDPNTPIEETITALSELVSEGKIGAIALSEVRASTIRRAHKIHPIATVEAELSLWATDIIHNGVASTCAELGIPITAYSPICRGALAAKLSPTSFSEHDFRRSLPKFQPDTIEANNKLTDEVMKLASKKNCTPAQIAISWVRTLSGRNGLPVIIPIPGASSPERVEENAKQVELTEEDMKEIEEVLERIKIVGERYGGHSAAIIEG